MVELYSAEVIQEANEILSVLKKNLPKTVDGKEAILELQRIDYNWKQMEWIGWYFEHLLFSKIVEAFGGNGGPTFGNTFFDYKKNFVWDFKVHPIFTPKGTRNHTLILNDKEAIDLCIDTYGGLGFIVLHGYAVFDETGAFKEWHDALKGGHSDYENERIKRGAPSRKRKCAFEIDHVEVIFFKSREQVNHGVSDHWLVDFQKGMRNADGSPRRSKYALKTTKIPDGLHPVNSLKM